jgi:hypothetical protein
MNVQTKAAAAIKKKRNTKYLDTTLKDTQGPMKWQVPTLD